jgi:hypothetical protein
MRAFWSFGLALILATGLIAPAYAQGTADGKTPDTAIQLAADQPQHGAFTGQWLGGFAYYWLNYPGDGRTGMLTMSFEPSDPITAGAVGINTWQGNGSLGSIKGTDSGTRGQTKLSFFSNKAGAILVQLFNYANGKEVSYDLTLTGVLTPSGTATAAAPSASSPSAPVAASSVDNPAPLTAAGASGSLRGDTGGAYAYYTFPYPGNSTTAMVTITFRPVDVSNGFGISVWQGNVRLGTITGSGSTLGANTLSFFSSQAGPVMLKVENYIPGRTASYSVSVSGIPLP